LNYGNVGFLWSNHNIFKATDSIYNPRGHMPSYHKS